MGLNSTGYKKRCPNSTSLFNIAFDKSLATVTFVGGKLSKLHLKKTWQECFFWSCFWFCKIFWGILWNSLKYFWNTLLVFLVISNKSKFFCSVSDVGWEEIKELLAFLFLIQNFRISFHKVINVLTFRIFTSICFCF